MTPELAMYAKIEPGYLQFCQRYGLVAADPKTRDEYFWWYWAQLREEGRRITAIEMGMELGMKQGIELGQLITLLRQIKRKRLNLKTKEQIISELELDEEEIKTLYELGLMRI